MFCKVLHKVNILEEMLFIAFGAEYNRYTKHQLRTTRSKLATFRDYCLLRGRWLVVCSALYKCIYIYKSIEAKEDFKHVGKRGPSLL